MKYLLIIFVLLLATPAYADNIDYKNMPVPEIIRQENPPPEPVVVIRYLQPKPFDSLEEIETFLDYWEENKRTIFKASDIVDGGVSNNCKEMARQLQQMAAEQGYDFPTESLTASEMLAVYGKKSGYHRVNKAWIPGVGEWYYDFNTDKLWKVW